jgi:hypothetical protein
LCFFCHLLPGFFCLLPASFILLTGFLLSLCFFRLLPPGFYPSLYFFCLLPLYVLLPLSLGFLLPLPQPHHATGHDEPQYGEPDGEEGEHTMTRLLARMLGDHGVSFMGGLSLTDSASHSNASTI